MNRLIVVVALIFGVCIAAVSQAASPDKSSKENSPMLKTVFHVNFGDEERHKSGLNNIENILKEFPDTQIEVVCHGDGIALLDKKSKLAESVQSLMKVGVRFAACENTMKKKSLVQDDLVPGTKTVPSGAVEVIRKQGEGFAYFRP